MKRKIEPISEKNGSLSQQRVYGFSNGYGALVTRNEYSYGSDRGLFELAVLIFNEYGGWHQSYDTPLTDDVIGSLKEREVQKLLKKISKLPIRRIGSE